MFPGDNVQVLKNNNPAIRCETFSCFESAAYFIGRPDGPRNLAMNLCSRCYRSLVDSIILLEGEALLQRIKELEQEEIVRMDKETYGGREFACKECGEVFYSPQRLGAHVKSAHRGEVKNGADV